jgi:DoxX-like family
MNPNTHVVATSNKWLWAGRVVSALPALGLLFSAIMKLMKPPAALQGFTHFGYPQNLIVVIALLELGSTIVYLIPRVSVLGAILMTGYLGGAPTSASAIRHSLSRSLWAFWSGLGFICATSGCAHSFH